MNDCKKCRLLFDDAFFGELTADDNVFLDRHLETCSKCRTELKQNTALLTTVTKRKKIEPRPNFWDDYTANLHRRMSAEGHLDGGILVPKKRLRKIFDRFTIHSLPTWALHGAAAFLLVIVGIVIGRSFFVPDSISQKDELLLTADLNRRQQETLQRTNHFIDRSRVILLAIENFDPEIQNVRAINLPFQRKISRDLVIQANTLKQDLSEIHRRRLKELVSELEVILLQIANMDPGSEMEILQLVNSGRYIRGMLYEIRINDLRRSTYKTNEKNML